jgi:nitrile hydratase accessory protein
LSRPERNFSPPAVAPVFAAPWQAQAFALAVMLQDGGVFTAHEWAQELGRQLRVPGVCDDGSDYYERWLAALEALAIDKGLVSALTLNARATRLANPEA